MRPLIRISLSFLFASLSTLTLLAGNGSAKPVLRFTLRIDQIRGLNGLLSTPLEYQTDQKDHLLQSTGTTARICSCQILDLESRNYSHQRVVLLAEKTSHGSSGDFRVAKNHIQKEKKHLKQMFYDKVKLVSETQGTGSCKSFYYRLKTADSQLQLYEILNADIN